jgi:VWFA-related protein
MRLRLHWLIWLSLLELSAFTLQSQTSAPEAVGPTLKTTARLVVVDVVATDWYGQPIPGLRKEDFGVFEDGQPQTISVFEEHTGKAPAALKPPALPPDTFSNFPRADAPDSLNVVLLDALNTPITDQSFVHQKVLKYLTGMHTGEPIAIFILSKRLRLVHGFTSDLSALLAALNDQKSGSSPQSSPLLRSAGEVQAGEQAVGEMQLLAVLDPHMQASMDALRQFQAEEESSQTDVRVRITLSSLEYLAQYLSGFPGRKNVVWFSGAFPLNILRDPSKGLAQDRQYEEELHKTADALTRARVAVYPVEAGGLAPDSLYEASALPLKVTSAAGATQAQVNQLQDDSLQRTAKQATMEEMARDTGGKAFYNTNGLDEALARAIHDGARYYTLDYTPTNRTMDGGYRHIQVKLTHGHHKLAYRRGYNADDERRVRAVAEKLATGDPLQPLMASGLPDFAQIRYLMSVKPSTPQPELTAARAGDNLKLEGAFTRMDVDLAVSEHALQLEAAPDGRHHGTLEVTLIAYDRYGNPMNWLVRNSKISLSPERYKALWNIGLHLHFEFDVPRGASYLRSGVCDLATGKAGTMEVLLKAPAAAVPQDVTSK